MTNKLFYLILGILFSGIINAQETRLGVDLSYVNEMEDCDAVYYENGTAKDVYDIFSSHQAQVVRFRLWHNPTWTNYSNYSDVEKGISRAKAAGMEVLLDFHYSDTWADPSAQTRPAAWSGITDLTILADSVYNYTAQVLNKLKAKDLTPEYVQIGNETNGNIMVEEGEELYPNDWTRNVKLFKAGIQAANDVDSSIKTVLHVANPENGDWWFTDAASNGLTNFDIIGLSYYPQWHKLTISQVGTIVKSLTTKFSKPVWIVETGYPWTLDNNGDASNILTEESILAGYSNPPSPKSQKNFLLNLTYAVISNGGMGTIYWEPAWVTTSCSTQWGTGSHYENAAFFDFSNNLHAGIEYLDYDYSVAPSTSSEVTFYVDMTGVNIVEAVYVTGDFTGTNWQFIEMTPVGNNIYKYSTTMQKGDEGAYIFTVKADWDMATYHEHVPAECAPMWGTHRQYVIEDDEEVYAFKWSSCETITVGMNSITNKEQTLVYPNPFSTNLTIKSLHPKAASFRVISIDGSFEKIYPAETQQINSAQWADGVYFIQWMNTNHQVIDSIKIIKAH